METAQSQCPWCKRMVDSSLRSCPSCGAPVGRATRVTASGWTELPPIRDMARLRVGSSTCQIEGTYVPVADFNLTSPAETVYFAHHALLWKDPQVEVRRMPLKGAFKRLMAGMPVVMTEASGPGHVAFSRDEPGEMIALPLDRDRSGVYVREHLFLAATRSVQYDWISSDVWFQTGSGNESETHYPLGQFLDHFDTQGEPGLLLLHASGNVFVRELADGEGILVKPTALVYMDASVRTAIHVDYASSYSYTSTRVIWLHLTGPGRVAIQSAYQPMEENGRSITGMSSRANLFARQAGGPAAAAAAFTATAWDTSHLSVPQQEVLQMILAARVNGAVPAEAMPAIIQAATERGLSGWDVSALINALRSHPNVEVPIRITRREP